MKNRFPRNFFEIRTHISANIKYGNKQEQNERMKNIKAIFLAWSRNVDINVYTKMIDYSPNYKIQAIWLLILLGSTGATFYFISKSILDYLKYEVVSQTNIVSEIPTDFPTVTFCDGSPFTTIYSQSFLETVANKNGIKDYDSSWKTLLYLSIFYFVF